MKLIYLDGTINAPLQPLRRIKRKKQGFAGPCFFDYWYITPCGERVVLCGVAGSAPLAFVPECVPFGFEVPGGVYRVAGGGLVPL